MDLLLDSSGDLSLVGGNFALVTGRAEVAQRLSLALEVERGEWYLDTGHGVPWKAQVLRKSPDLGVIDALLKTAIVAVEGVVELTHFASTFTANTRSLSVEFEVEVVSGETLTARLNTAPEASAGGLMILFGEVG